MKNFLFKIYMFVITINVLIVTKFFKRYYFIFLFYFNYLFINISFTLNTQLSNTY